MSDNNLRLQVILNAVDNAAHFDIAGQLKELAAAIQL